MVEGPLPFLRHRLQRDGRDQGRPCRGDAWRHAIRGQSRPQLRERLFPLEDHVRRGPTDRAAVAHEGRRISQGRRFDPGQLGPGIRRDGGEVQGGPPQEGPHRRRNVRVRPVDGLGRLCRREAHEGRVQIQQHRSQRAALHGFGRRRVHANLRHRRAHGVLRRYRRSGRLRALGLQHVGDAPDSLDPCRRPPLQRAACQGRRSLHVREPQFRPRRYSDRVSSANRSGDPEFHRQAHHRYRPGKRELRRQARQFPSRQRRHRLRAAPRPSACSKKRPMRRRPAARSP